MFDGLLYAAFYGFLLAFADGPVLLIFGGAILIVYGIISYIRTSRTFIKIVREHYAVKTKKNLGGLFFKGFLLNFVNFGVLAGWIATIIMANALTITENGVFLFLTTVIITLFLTDMVKISIAKKLK